MRILNVDSVGVSNDVDIVTSSGGDIIFGDSANTLNGEINSANDVILNAAGGIIDDDDALGDTDITANGTATLTAVTGIGSGTGALEREAIDLDVVSVSATNNGDGHIQLGQITPSSDLLVVQVSQTDDAGDSIVIAVDDGDLTIQAAGGGINATGAGAASGSILLQTWGPGGSGGNLNINDTVDTILGQISLVSIYGGVLLAETGDITSVSGDISVQATAAGQVITMTDTGADSAIITATGGTIDIDADGNITLGSIVATNSTSITAIDIDSASGSILDGGDTAVDVIANTAVAQISLHADDGIGTGNAIETQVADLSAELSSTGVINILESDGAILRSLTTQGATVDDITISSTTGDLEIGVIVAGPAGDVTLDAIAGSITDATAEGSDLITGNVLDLDAATAIGATGQAIDTEAVTLSANTDTNAGDIYIDEATAVTVTSASTFDGDIDISTTNGSLTVYAVDSSNDDGAGADDDVTLTAGGVTSDVLLGDTGNDGIVTASNAINLTAGRNIVDNETTDNDDLVGVSATLQAGANIGDVADTTGVLSLGATDFIEVQLGSITLTVTGEADGTPAGDIAINDTSGAGTLTISDLNTPDSTSGADSAFVFIVKDNGDLDGSVLAVDNTAVDSNDHLGLIAPGTVTVSDGLTLNTLRMEAANLVNGNSLAATNFLAKSAASETFTGMNVANIDIAISGTNTLTYTQTGNTDLNISDLDATADGYGLLTADGDITVTHNGAATTGAIILNAVVEADTINDTVTLDSTNDEIVDGGNDNIEDVQAYAVVLNAATGIGAGTGIPAETTAIDLDATRLSADNSSSSDIQINETDGDTADGLAIGFVNNSDATSAIVINSSADIDSITNDGTADITGGTISLVAASGGIGNTSVVDVTASTALNADTNAGDDGNILIDSIGNLPLGAVTAGAGNITIDSTGNMSDANNDTAGNNLAGGVGTLTAAGGIGDSNALETALTSVSATTSATGTIELDETDAITLTSVVSDGAAADDIIVNAGGTITVTDADATLGDVTLDAGGAINSTTNDGVADVTGATINLTAAVGGIGTGSVVDVTATTALNADTDAGDDGNILIDSIGDLRLGLVNAGGGNVTLNSTGDITAVDNGIADVEGGIIILDALVGGIGTGGGVVDVTASTRFDADSSADGSNILIDSIGNLPIGLVDAAGGMITLASTGNMTDQDNGTANDLFGSAVTLTAVTGIGSTGTNGKLEAITSTVTATNTSSGGIFLNSLGGTAAGVGAVDFSSIQANPAGNVELMAVTGSTLTDVDAANGTIDVLVTGADINAVAVNTANNNQIDIETVTTGDITVDLVGAGTGTVNITSAGDIDSDVDDGVADVVGGTINLEATSGGIGNSQVVDVTGSTALNADTTADNANIQIDSINSLPAGVINAGGGNVTLDSTAAITDANGGTVNITGNILTVDAAGGISLDTTISSLNASISAAGAIDINETNAITLTDVDTSNGAITIVAGGAIIATDVQSLTDTDTNDIELISDTGNINVGNVSTGGNSGDVRLEADLAITDINGLAINIVADEFEAESGSGVDLDTTVNQIVANTSTAGVIVIEESNAVVLENMITANGAITVTAGGAITASNVVSTTDNDANDISITSTGGAIAVGVVNAGTTAGDVNLVASGAITDGDATTDVTAQVLTATAGGGISLDTNIVSLTATTSAAGAIDINETNAITLTNVTSSNGAITVTAGGAITATNVVSTTDNDANDISISTTTGNIVIDLINALALGDIIIDTNAGSVNAIGTGPHIIGDDLTIDATTGIGNDVAINTSDIDLLNTNTTNGNIGIVITAAEAVTVQSMTTGTGAISLTQNGNQSLTLNSVSTTTGGITISNNGGVGADLLISNNGISADGDTVTITVAGAIDDEQTNPDLIVDITATTLNITASEGIGGTAHVDTVIDNLNLIAGGNVSMNNSGSLDLVQFNTIGNATLVNNGAITDSGTVSITGVTTISSGGNDIILDSASNDFNTLVLSNTGNVTLVDTDNLEFGTSNINGDLVVESGTVTQSGSISVSGTTGITVGNNNDITLTNAANDFSGRVSVLNGNNVALTDTNTLTLDWMDINGNLITNAVTTSLSPVPDAARTTDFNVGGDIDFSSNGALNIARDTVLLSGTNTVLLTGTQVTGEAALQILTPLLSNLTISNGSGAGLLDARVFANFTGHLVIGGAIETPTRPAISNGSEVVTVNTDLLSIAANVALRSGSDITLLGSNISLDINSVVSSGGVGGNGAQNALDNDQVSLIAVGDANGGVSGPGDITGIYFPGTIEGASVLLVAANDIINANNLIVDANGGNLQAVVGTGNTPTFGVLNATPIDSTDATIPFLNGLAVGTGLNLNNLTFVQAQTLILGNLIGLEQIAFIDVGLFEEDLTLYGTIGQGIALSLAQCEEIEGCAPDVTETELDELIEGLEARIDEMERRLEEGAGRDQEQLESLLAGYEQELENFNNYKIELQQFYEADEDFDDGFGDEFGEDFATGEIRRLNTILDTVAARIDWLENLKANTDLRAQLSENTGVELTIEAIDEIIRATQQQIRFIERQIQQLLDGTQASLGSGFVAEVGDITLSRFPRYENELYSYNQYMKQVEYNWY